MGRHNSRGLELSFKPLRGGRGRGRWFKKIGGRAVYFGWGDGVSDRDGYKAALTAYRQWLDDAKSDARQARRTALVRRLQIRLSVLDVNADRADLQEAREVVAQLRALDPTAAAIFDRVADGEEKRRLLVALEDRPLDDIRRAMGTESAAMKSRTVSELLDNFLAVQRQRMERRQKLDKLRAAGQTVKEAAKQNISEARFASIFRDVATMKASVGTMKWDATEASAARIVRKFRDESEALVLSGDMSPHTFNDRIKLARMLCAWAEVAYELDRLPRDRGLFAKYTVHQSTAKAIPIDTLKKLWDASDDRGRCWLLLGLNCGYYAQDISDLTAEMINGTHLHHVRGKTGVRVRYKLWGTTKEYLKKLAPDSGRVFATEKGTPLVHYGTAKKSGEPVRIDNVRNWFFRLCRDLKITGFSFSNVRDTATSHIENINRAMSDLFDAHRDKRQAVLYIDGAMVDTKPLDDAIDELEKRLNIWSRKPRRPG